MTLYVAFVAITNVLLGVLLTRFYSPPPAKACISPDRTRSVTASAHKKPAVAAAPLAPKPQAELPESKAAQADCKKIDEAQLPESVEVAAIKIERLPDFFHHLNELRSRIEYCVTADNKRLLQSAAKQLSDRLKTFYAQFADAVYSTSRSAAQLELLAGLPTEQVELLAAQIETTSTNITMIDWSENLVDVGAKLKHELENLLAEHKRLVQGP